MQNEYGKVTSLVRTVTNLTIVLEVSHKKEETRTKYKIATLKKWFTTEKEFFSDSRSQNEAASTY